MTREYKVAIQSVDSYLPEKVNKAMDELMSAMGYDLSNPFQGFIRPGMKVFIKPNWVASSWRESCPHKDSLYSVITHPSVIEAVADRVAIALNGRGEIIIADNPSIDADFEELMDFTGIRRLESKYNVPCRIYDLRPLVCKDLKDYGKRNKMSCQSGDPNGEVRINLGKESLLAEVDSTLFRGVFDEREETVAAHTADTQLYTFSKSFYNADVYISIPKMKTHQKVGATLNLKGLVGSVTQKNQLVHWREGSPEDGGDAYPNKASMELAKHAKITHRGAWPGNDTIWRMVVDLYQAVMKKERSYFTIIDGIMAGEGQGPFCPTSKHANTLVAADDLLAADIITAKLMGLDPHKIKYLEHFIQKDKGMIDHISVSWNCHPVPDFLTLADKYLDFVVPDQWKGVKTGEADAGR